MKNPFSRRHQAAAKNAPEKSAAPRAPAALLAWPATFQGKLIAWASPVRNPRLLVAYVPGTDPNDPLALVSVQVADNRNFLRGMELPARHVDAKLYELVGPCPPRRGRWR